MSKMISMTEDGYVLCSDHLTAVEYVNMTLSVQIQMFNQLIAQAPDDIKDKIKGELYDMYNQAASEFLAAFAPEIELRPDLTTEAILKAENEILDKTTILDNIKFAIGATGHTDAYSIGMCNGLALAQSYITGEEPEFVSDLSTTQGDATEYIAPVNPAIQETESKVIELKAHRKSDDDLIPLNALDSDGKPTKPVHK